jgi:hypothetical protein
MHHTNTVRRFVIAGGTLGRVVILCIRGSIRVQQAHHSALCLAFCRGHCLNVFVHRDADVGP